MRYLLLALVITFISCGKKKGCLNQFASNYDREALVDCCCEFNVDQIIEDLEGTHTVKEICSGSTTEYEISIERNANQSEGIIISNFNNSDELMTAKWNLEEFALDKNWQTDDCAITVTGSLHRNNGKIHIIYAAIPPTSCGNYNATTCEARGL